MCPLEQQSKDKHKSSNREATVAKEPVVRSDSSQSSKEEEEEEEHQKQQTESSPPSEVETHSPPSLSSDDEDDSSSDPTPCCGPRRRSLMRYVLYAFTLWQLNYGMNVVLQRFGIHFGFDENVVHTVFEQQLSRFNESMPRAALSYLTHEKKRPGFQLAQDGASHKYPVILVHGFVTSGLEVWAGKDCAKAHFRQRFWAATYGARSMLTDRYCWVEHMKLDPETGVDPPGIRLRAASGFEAIDYFMANYWVFAKMIENLADIGYSPSDMAVEPFDWRLSFQALEERDGYLTTLKHKVEVMHKISGRKVILTSHSMGVLVVHYFFAWVTTDEKHGGGGGGKDWVDRHVHAYINLAGSHLGVSKAVTSLFSGDLSDLVMNNPVDGFIENFFGRKIRRELWQTWGSIWMMLPKAPDLIWGIGADMCRNRTSDVSNETTAVDPFCPRDVRQPSPLLVMSDTDNRTVQSVIQAERNARGVSPLVPDLRKRSYTARESIDYLKAYGAGYGKNLSNAANYSFHDKDETPQHSSPRLWHDPTRTPLPHAPNLKIYCLYGVGLETERAYFYRRNVVEDDNETNVEEPQIVLDPTVQDPERKVHTGIRYTDGDGSVPLISLGYICADAWQRESSGLNPGRALVYTREYKHRSEFKVDDPVRGGPNSAEHVDFLGNVDMMTDLLRIVSDFEVEKVNENQIVSEIKEIAAEINSRGGIFKKKRFRFW